MKKVLTLLTVFLLFTDMAGGQKVHRIGIIGLDTSHSTAFTELLNGDNLEDPYVRDFEVVAAYPYGSKTIASSYERIPGYIREVQKFGVQVVESIDALLELCDYVLLETNDGHPHLEQAAQVFRSGKTCYIDKPLGATLAQVLAIRELARQYGAPVFSSSALRFSPQNVKLHEGAYGPVLGADCYSPHKTEPTHPDFGFYGIHGVETLYTLMGPGCEKVSRMHTPQGDIVTGVWADGRLGTFRALVEGPALYGGTAFTADGAVEAGGYAGYKVLLDRILDYLVSGEAPVSLDETVEIFAFMEASNLSLERGGKSVSLTEVMKKAQKEARRLLKKVQ
ncbi:MAG: Gfo/Idh/MocA family oxidoreductase [Bacteroidales bacterium]|nr:Gfo/Idh/MocA family oxidoreductase [Bacteroidales bacterium]